MNLLRQCSFIDRNRHMPIELDDIIEENYKKNTDELFYIILYFTANWLPDASNKHLNKKIESFYLNKNLNQNKALNFELIFISSDKTKNSYDEFLNANKYIRYSLAFQEQELKSQLCKYFKIYGIPYLTLVSLKLNSDLKIVDFQANKSNIKQAFLADENGNNFPWISDEKNVTKPDPNIKKSCIKSNETKSENKVRIDDKINEKRNIDDEYGFLEELIDNLKLINKNLLLDENQKLNSNKFNFLFILFGTCESEINQTIIENLIKFWKKFCLKHKFIVAYLDYDSECLNYFPKDVPWYTIIKTDLKIKIAEFYRVTTAPKLIILDMDTGCVLNNQLRFGIIEYIHEFCNKQVSIVRDESVKKNDEFNFMFDFDIDDFCLYNKPVESKTKFKKRMSKEKLKKKLDKDLLNDFQNNLVRLTNKSDLNEDADTFKLTNNGMNIYYLLYFCSDFTTSNMSLFENVIKFLVFMQEKFECIIKIILISSDFHEKDYEKLITKFKINNFDLHDETNKKKEEENHLKLNHFDRYALHFNAKHIKEKIFQQMNVIGIPWFSLINGNTGEILCENLKIFILNSQLRDMIF